MSKSKVVSPTTVTGFDSTAQTDGELLEEIALAMAQSTIQNAINESGITRAVLARRMNRPRSFISKMLSGSHNLTIRTFARAMAACGFEARFQKTPVVRTWQTSSRTAVTEATDEKSEATALVAVAFPSYALAA